MKAYKATNKDMTCNDFQYELGKEFVHDGELKLCSSGFHFCKRLEDIDSFYPFGNSDNRFFEIEIPEDAIVMDDLVFGKSVTNKIKFIRELDESDFEEIGIIREYDSNGNLIHYKDSDGYEEWNEYDSNGNIIHYKDSNGYECWKEYDSNGNEIHYKNSYGNEYWYDSDGNEIHIKDSYGYEYWYDSNGTEISEEEFDKLHSSPYNGKIVTTEGKSYQLKEIK
jgi:YD repeat-containing protein